MDPKNRIMFSSVLVIALCGLLISVQADGDEGQPPSPAPCFSSAAIPDPNFSLSEVNGNYQYLGMFIATPEGEELAASFNTSDRNRKKCYKMEVTSNAETNVVTLKSEGSGSLDIQLDSANSGKGTVLYAGKPEDKTTDALFPIASNGALVFSTCASGTSTKSKTINFDYVSYYAKDGTSPQDAYNYISSTLVGMGMTNGYYIPWCKDGQAPEA